MRKPKKIVRFGFKDFDRWWLNKANHISIKPFQKVYRIDKIISELEEYFSGKKSLYQ